MDQRRFQLASWLRDNALKLLLPRPRSLAIFGSFAGGVINPQSDIDLLLIGDDIPKRPLARAHWFNPLRREFSNIGHQFPGLPEVLSPVYFSENGWNDTIGLKLSISQQSWILFDDGYLSQSLRETSELISQKKWIREDVPTGGWFWIPRDPAA